LHLFSPSSSQSHSPHPSQTYFEQMTDDIRRQASKYPCSRRTRLKCLPLQSNSDEEPLLEITMIVKATLVLFLLSFNP